LCCDFSAILLVGLRAYKAGDAEVGRESTVDAYLDSLMSVFGSAENPVGVWRVLRDDGLCWVNLGTSYAGSWGDSGHRPERDGIGGSQRPKNSKWFARHGHPTDNPPTSNVKNLGGCKMRLRRDLTPEQMSYVLAELSKADLTADSTEGGLP
jgi:hypothetical protein